MNVNLGNLQDVLKQASASSAVKTFVAPYLKSLALDQLTNAMDHLRLLQADVQAMPDDKLLELVLSLFKSNKQEASVLPEIVPPVPQVMNIHTWSKPDARVTVNVRALEFELTRTADSKGYCFFPDVPKTAVLLLSVQADGYENYAQLKQVTPDCTLAVTQELVPLHKPVPAPETWFPIDTDFCGWSLPSIAAYGKTARVFSIIYPCYPDQVRKELRDAMVSDRFNAIVLDPAPQYRDYYPGGNWYQQPEAFAVFMREVLDVGLRPILMLSDDVVMEDSPEAAVAKTKARMEKFLTSPAIVPLLSQVCFGWEANDHITPKAYEACVRWVRSVLPPPVQLFVHMTPGHAAMSEAPESEQQWWTRMAADNVLDGIFLQLEPRQSLEEQQARIEDFTARLTGGLNAWPTRQADGSLLRVVVFEFSAYLEVNERMETAEARRRHAIFAGMPGVSGVADQP